MAPSRRPNLLRSMKKSEVAKRENSSKHVKNQQAKNNIQSASNIPSSQHTTLKRAKRKVSPAYNYVGVLDEIQPMKLGVDEDMLLDNLEDDLSFDEDMQNIVPMKTEIKLEEHDTSIGEHIFQEENLEKSMEADKSTQANSCNSIPGSTDGKHNVDGSSGSHTVDHTFEADEETQASERGFEETADDFTSILEKALKGYCKTHIRSQNMLYALAYNLHPEDIAILQDIITSGQELASSIRLMANTVQILAVAERMNSKAAIIRTRIELAKAKREDEPVDDLLF